MYNTTGILSVLNGSVYTSLPDPQSMTISIYDLDAGGSTGRNQEGLMLRDRKAVKEKIQCSWGVLWEDQAEALLDLLKEPFFTMKYYSPYYGVWREVECYVGDRTFPVYNGYDTAHPEEFRYTGVTMNFIER